MKVNLYNSVFYSTFAVALVCFGQKTIRQQFISSIGAAASERSTAAPKAEEKINRTYYIAIIL